MIAGILADHIGPFEYNDHSEALVMLGTPLPSQDPLPAVQLMLKHLQRLPQVQDVDIQFTLEDFIQMFKKTKERTASSPSGRHYGHYKAACHNTAIAQVHTEMMAFAIEFTQVPERWLNATQVPIEKIPGCPRIDKLRILQLLEGDLNKIFQFIWARRMMSQVNRKQLLQNQHAQAQHSAISGVLLKRLTADIMCQLRDTGAIFNNDAQGCYDRVIP